MDLFIINNKMNITHIQNEINEVLEAINDGISDDIIKNSYDYSNSMLDFIKSKDANWFTFLFDYINVELKKNYPKDQIFINLRNDLLSMKDINSKLINYIIDSIFSDQNNVINNSIDIINENNTNDNTNDNINDNIIDDIQIEDVINNITWRTNQIDAINKTIEQNFSSGIHNQIMGAGKTWIILNTIHQHLKSTPNKNLYIITTNRQEILKDLFFNKDGSINNSKKDFLKHNDIIDLDNYRIIVKLNFIKTENNVEYVVNNKTKKIKLSKKRPSILIVNTDYFKALDFSKSIKYNRCNLIIFDECHGVSAPKFYNVIRNIKYDHKIPIIGFSATPLRDKAENKLQDIFSKTMKKDSLNKKLNIISNYDFINAIKDEVILPPYYILCEVNKTINNRIGKSNKDITKKILIDTLKEAPYNKVIGWCRNIAQLKEYYIFIKNNFPKYNVYCSSYKDKSMKESGFNADWNEFINQEKNSIMLCVHKGREGCDIKNLDTAIYLDAIQKRSLLVALQTSGRVLRKDKLNKKTCGLIIDTFVNVDGIQIEHLTTKRIINYYKQIFTLCEDSNYKNQKEAYEEMMKICEKIIYDEKRETIIVKIDDNIKHDMKFKLQLKTKTYDFWKMKNELIEIIDKMFNIERETKFKIIMDKLKKSKWFSINTSNFWETYNELPDKDKLGIPFTAEKLFDDYKDFFDNKSWYDLLDLNTNKWYKTINECKNAIYNLYKKKIDEKIYRKLQRKDDRLPVNPCEFYKINGFKQFIDVMMANKLELEL